MGKAISRPNLLSGMTKPCNGESKDRFDNAKRDLPRFSPVLAWFSRYRRPSVLANGVEHTTDAGGGPSRARTRSVSDIPVSGVV
jgi:hypothetical protein